MLRGGKLLGVNSENYARDEREMMGGVCVYACEGRACH